MEHLYSGEQQEGLPSPSTSRQHLWFVPGDGIAREVIVADIQRYLGPEALCTVGNGTHDYQDVPGYWITAYRTLTSQMIMDLKHDTMRWKLEKDMRVPDPETWHELIPDLPAAQIAERCGWQVGLEKFLTRDQTGTPLALTARGTLGRGSLGIVEEVFAIENQPMVQKRVHIPRRREPAQRYRTMVQDEIENLKHLRHQHIIKILGSYEERRGVNDVQICLLMWPSGHEDLGIFLEESYPNATYGSRARYDGWIQSWLCCLASALAYMHSERVHHEDIKPTNIIRRGDQIYFTDFSSSRKLQSEQDTSTASPALASHLYAAPEALRDETGDIARHGSRSDVYSLGLVFFEMLCVLEGRTLEEVRSALFYHQNTIKQYHRVIHLVGTEVLVFGDSLQTELYRSCIQRMILPDRKQRPSALEVANRLTTKLQGRISCPCVSLHV
ncbi:dual specificity mitogen-activated protein kinase kinase 1 [Stagonosporopsis vannaccii]|nr:dual specificity mitogen-activated protein kinase kinase 1 [Stagonosporopsis vannaccii]